MALTCAACGRANDDDASFCQQCAAPVTPPTPVGPSTFAPPAGPPSDDLPAAGGPPRKGKPAPRWLVALVVVAVVALAAVMAFVFFPRSGGGDETGESSGPTAGAMVAASSTSALDQYLAGASGPKADRLAAITRDGTVKTIVRFSGQQIRQIAYSPDGKWLACIAGTRRRSDLWVFDAASGVARQATANMPGVVAVDSIAWLSPRNLLLAGYGETPKAAGQNAGFLDYDVVTEKTTPLAANDGAALRGCSVSASRDGAKVAFVTYTDHKTDRYGKASAVERLEVLDRGSGAVTQLGHEKAVLDVDARTFDEPLISPEGQAIIYRRAAGDVGTRYTVVAVDGTVLMPEKQATMPAGYAWDPGGTKVVFTDQPLGAGRDASVTFWQFDTEAGGAPLALAVHPGSGVQDLSWSPDGSTIAWAAYDPETDRRSGIVYLMPATGGDSSALVRQALSPVWAPGATEPLQTSPSP